MAYKYAVISQDEPTGYIGGVRLSSIPMVYDVINLNGVMYVIADLQRTNSLNKIYVRKVDRIRDAELDVEEFESDIRKKPLGEVVDFMKKHDIKLFNFSGQVRLEYPQPLALNRFQDIEAVGTDLVDALLKLRNDMIRQGLIQRGEW